MYVCNIKKSQVCLHVQNHNCAIPCINYVITNKSRACKNGLKSPRMPEQQQVSSTSSDVLLTYTTVTSPYLGCWVCDGRTHNMTSPSHPAPR